MSIEAMRQGVEALDEAANVLTSRMFADAAAALREAIEQAEKQEPVAWLYVNADMPTNRQLEWTETHHGYAGNWLKYPLYAAPPAAQEPVAYKWKGELFTPGEIEMLDVTNPVPLYEHPRQWVGLTNDELEEVFPAIATYHPANKTLYRSIARAIEAKLKAKNT